MGGKECQKVIWTNTRASFELSQTDVINCIER